MKVTLYSYNGRSDAINKLSSAVEKYSGNVRTYGTVTQLNMRFELSRLYDANYAAYEFDGKTFFGFLDIVSTAEGVYIYQIIVDALTTAYYNGCMNHDTIVKYSSEGTSLFEDSRLQLVEMSERFAFRLNTWNSSSYIVMVVLDESINANYQAVGGYSIYLFTTTQWEKFVEQFAGISVEEQCFYGQSILSIYAIPSFAGDEGPPGIWISSNVQLIAVNTLSMSSSLIQPPKAYKSLLLDADCKRYSGGSSYKALEIPEGTFASIVNGLMYALYNSQAFLYIPYIGTINFKLRDVCSPMELENLVVGVKIYVNYISATLNASLYTKINGSTVEYPEFSVTTNITEQIPLAIDTSKQEWFKSLQMGRQLSGQFLTFDIAGALSTLQEAAFIDRHGQIGSWSVIGGHGGNISRTRSDSAMLKIIYRMPEDFDAFRENFGAPDHKLRNISSLKGYIMTERARLPYNGLPGEIIKQAESDLDGGVWML